MVRSRLNEMQCVGHGEILDAEVVNAEGESGLFRAMAPESRGEGH
jgi:hypothetical protein